MMILLGTMHNITIIGMTLTTMITIWHMRWIVVAISKTIRTEMIGIESLIEHITVHRCEIVTEIGRMHTITIHIETVRIVAIIE